MQWWPRSQQREPKRKVTLADDEQELSVLLPGSSAPPQQPTRTTMVHAMVSIKGMHCSACSTAVESTLRALPGVASASVALLSESAEVAYDSSTLQEPAILAAIEAAGFEPRLVSSAPGAGAAGAGAAGPTGQVVGKLEVGGMHCSACSSAVEAALGGVPGVQIASVSLPLGQAEVVYNPAEAAEAQLVAAVEAAGFEARPLSQAGSNLQLLRIRGMTCAACASAAEAALCKVLGVQGAAVSLATGQVEVRYDPVATGPRHLVAAVEAAGFEAEALDARQPGFVDANREEVEGWRRQLVLAAALTAPVILVAMVLPLMPCMSWLYSTQVLGFPLDQLVKWAFTTPVQFWCGLRFHRGAITALRNGRANMDVLVSLGTSAAYAYSAISIIHHHFARHHATGNYQPTDFFETSAMLVTLVLLGKYLEAAAKGKTSEAITRLCQLAPPSALLLECDDKGAVVGEREVPTSLVHRGDLLKLLPGSRVPADGEVVEGTSYVDESMLTGESDPVYKAAGDTVIGGTVNVGGPLRIRAARVGAGTALSQIVRLVEAAQLSKAPIQAFADRVSAVFVPVVVALALATWLAWWTAGVSGAYPPSWLPQGHTPFLFALLFGIAVLVIACPCALGLATPTAVMVGTGVAAAHGILIKGGEALERASRVDTIVFDKTGTVTEGRPHVVDFALAQGCWLPPQAVLELAAAVECGSEHPLASAVLSFTEAYLSQRVGQAAPGRGGQQQQQQWERWQGGQLHEQRQQEQQHHQREDKGSGATPRGRPPPRLEARDVDVLVGQGICGWVDLPSGLSPLPPDPQQQSATPSSSARRQQQQEQQQPPQTPGQLRVAVGSRRLMAGEGVEVGQAEEEYCRGMEGRGCTCMMVAAQRRLLGVLAVMDPIKPEARGVVVALHQLGMSCVLLTGDNWRTARAIAEQLGISQVAAEVLPAGKVSMIKELQQQQQRLRRRRGGGVAMVGDGINDSPALAAADLGLAVGSGTDVAMEAADYVLMRSDLEGVLTSLDLSRAIFSRIRLNYVWAMGYNVLMIPVAAGAFFPLTHVQLAPWVAGACMAFSSTSVICSSLLLRRYRRPKPVLRDLLVIKS